MLLLSPGQAFAQTCSAIKTVPTGFQEYYVLGRESHIYNLMNRVASNEGTALANNATNSVVSAVASANGEKIYYDHWEDGLDTGLNSTFPTFPNPQQASTLVLGDGNNANGRVCDYSIDPRVFPCNGTGAHDDALFSGVAMVFNSDQGIVGACAGPNPAPPSVAQLRCSVPVNPRGTSLRFDGGDRLVTAGGPVSLIHKQDPQQSIIGGAVEVLSRQAYAGATAYSIPAGEDLYLGDNTVTEIFKYVDIDLVAFEDATLITIVSPGGTGGTISFTLNRGQHYTNRNCTAAACANGLIDDATLAPFLRINAGTKISTTKPLAGMIHTGGDGTYSTDIFPILPDLLHGNDYLIASAGDDAAVNGSRPMNLYIFNPDPLSAITVTATDSVGTRNFNVPANSTVDYFSGAAPNRYVPANSTVRLTSTRNFWGLTVHDSQTNISDWGYSWLATKFLTTNYTVGYAPGTNAAPGPGLNRAPVWVGAVQDNTLVKIDLNNDGVFDRVDTNGDDVLDNGDLADPSCATPATLCVYRVNGPNGLGNRMSLRIFDPSDDSNTGTSIVANKPIAVVYGQDPELGVANDQTPDTGYTIYPTLQSFLDPVLTIDKAVSPAAVPVTGGTVTFTLTVKAFQFGDLTNNVLTDDLPPGLTGANYVSGSTLITYPNLSTSTADPAITPPATMLTLTNAGTTANATTTAAHGFRTGDVVTIAGATPAAYNGSFAIVVSSPTQFTYTMASNPGAAATGVISATLVRTRLTWTLVPSNLSPNQTLTLTFRATIPAGGGACFVNSATDRGNYGSSTFETNDQVAIIRTNVVLNKTVTDDGAPEPGDQLTYTITTTNNGAAAETGVIVSDLVPFGTTFLAGSITSVMSSGTALTGAYSVAQNSVQWTGTIPAGSTATLSFRVTIDPGNVAGTVLTNAAGYESALTGYFLSAPVQTVVVGPTLTRAKTITPGTVLHPGEFATFEITATNTGGGAATNVQISDPLTASNSTYVLGSMQASVNGAAFVTLTDAADADGGSIAGTTLGYTLAMLGPGQNVRFRFQVQVNAGTGGLNVANQAVITSTQTGADETNLVQVPIIGTAVVTGHLFVDTSGDGTQQAGEPNLPNVTINVTDSAGNVQQVTTDASGSYSATVPPGATILDVDQTDPDIPAGSTRTGGADTQNVTAPSGSTAVGFAPPALLFSKTSNAGGTVAPGQSVSYTVSLTNNTGANLANVVINDAVPTGTTFVSASVRIPTLRVTQYPIGATSCGGAAFTGVTCNLTLNQNLVTNYFLILQGGDGDDTSGTARNPNQNYVSLTGDPFATGAAGAQPGLANSGAANLITLTRGAASGGGSWQGVVSVVECLGDCAASGFLLRDVVRVTHANGVLTNPVNADTGWNTLGQAMLVAGFNGAGCNTADGTIGNHQTCQLRYVPSGGNTITWTRGAAPSASTSTVMVVEWGSEWTVNRANVTGTAGADGANTLAAYNTSVGFPAVNRANTWVWGTGFTSANGVGNSAEGVLITLGNGVAKNPSETTVAVGFEDTTGAVTKNFEVWALTHPKAIVDYRFKADGDGTLTNVNVPINLALYNKMALSYEGMSSTATNFSRPMFGARYLTASNVELRRRRPGTSNANGGFTSWVEGVDLSEIDRPSGIAAGAPPNIVTAAMGYTLAPGQTMTVTYVVTVNNPLAAGITQVTNSATVVNAPGATATVTDQVVRPAITVEPNNSGFATAGSTILFTHTVTNTSAITDAYALTLKSDLANWKLELIDPATGLVIATDTDGDGVWDGGLNVSTGNLAPGASKTYRVRATVPAGATVGTENTATLKAVSNRSNLVFAEGTDEITVLAPASFASVDVLPDQSGVVIAGSSVAYAHRVVNNTGAAEIFDLTAANTLGWTTTIHYDSNGDGVYTPGTDLQVANTATIPNGASQLVFLVVTAPPGTPAGTTDVAFLTAASRTNPTRYDSASDTTSVVAPGGIDLSGGGTRMVAPSPSGDTAIFPGTLYNLRSSSDTFTFSIGPSSLSGVDGLDHPTELWVEVAGVMTFLARDTTGDGSFEVGATTVNLAAGAVLNYELRQPIASTQRVPQAWATATATSSATGEKDSVTAEWLIAALTRASIRGLRVDARGVVEFATGSQRDTKSFDIYEVSDSSGSDPKLLTTHPVVSPLADSAAPILYRVETRRIKRSHLLIEETETGGAKLVKGPFEIGDPRLLHGLEVIERRLDAAGVPHGAIRVGRVVSAQPRVRRAERVRRSAQVQGVRIETEGAGVVEVALSALSAAAATPLNPMALRLTNLDRPVPFSLVSGPAGLTLRFTAEALVTDYTDRNVYLVTTGAAPQPMSAALTRSGAPLAAGTTRVEKNTTYLASAPADADPWLWDFLVSDGSSWPYGWWDPTGNSARFDLPTLAPGATGDVPVRLRFAGYNDYRHSVEARINGFSVGSLTFDGAVSATLVGKLPASALRGAGNELSLVYNAVARDTGLPVDSGYVYLDVLDLKFPTVPPATLATLASLSSYDPKLPSFRNVEYLIVTHPDFRDAAERIAQLKRAEGLKTAIAETDNIYDQLSGGVVDARAIQALVRQAAKKSGRLDYVLLLGDDSFDPNDYTATGAKSFVPSLYARDSGFGRVPAENLYADLNDDGAPDLAIGRLPAQTPAEADAYAEKVSRQTALLARSFGRLSFVVDNPRQGDAPFRAEAEDMAGVIGAPAATPFADLGDGAAAARAGLLSAWQDGAMITSYFGHGGPEIWADEAVLSVYDVQTLGAALKPSLVLMWACESQWYQYLWGPSLGEALLQVPDGGAVASFGPAGTTPPARKRALYDKLYRELRSNQATLGEMIRRAKAGVIAENPGAREVNDGFNLLGDPALKVPERP